MRWHFPSRCGDYTLTPDGAEAVRLVVVNPTSTELVVLGKLLKVARAFEWCGDAVGISPTGRTEITLGTTMAKAAPLLMEQAYDGQRTITVVTSKAGTVKTVFDDAEPEAIHQLNEESIPEAPEEEPEPEEEEPEPEVVPQTAVTVPQPRLGCPDPRVSKMLRASRVLYSVSTPSQWRTWLSDGWMLVRGGTSGFTYRVAHRHSRAAAAQRRVVWCCETQSPVCAWNLDLPPAEEVCSMKLMLEHREHLIVNEISAPNISRRIRLGGTGDRRGVRMRAVPPGRIHVNPNGRLVGEAMGFPG